MFIDFIKANKNLFIEELEACRKNGLKTYIYGAGVGAENIIKRFGTKFNFAGMLVDERYFTPGRNIHILEQVIACEKINLIIGHRGFKKENLKPFARSIEKIIDMDCFAGNYAADPTLFDKKFVVENNDKLTWVYNELQDETSRCALIGYVNQKISMDYKYLKDIYIKEGQYFDSEIIQLHNYESFVDCGAYVGDTAEEFVKRINLHGLNNYKAIYSFEPDYNNYKLLKEKGVSKLKAYCMGLSNKSSNMQVISKGSSSFITNDILEVGRSSKIDTLDNILLNKVVTFIKMDIEGYELDALKGAKNIIQKNKPKLAICIYHKKQDLYEIPLYIKSLVPDYKFYIRAYDYTATELVLYAVI